MYMSFVLNFPLDLLLYQLLFTRLNTVLLETVHDFRAYLFCMFLSCLCILQYILDTSFFIHQPVIAYEIIDKINTLCNGLQSAVDILHIRIFSDLFSSFLCLLCLGSYALYFPNEKWTRRDHNHAVT